MDDIRIIVTIKDGKKMVEPVVVGVDGGIVSLGKGLLCCDLPGRLSDIGI